MSDDTDADTNRGNLFASLPTSLPEEMVEELLRGPGVRIERIVSKGQTSEPGFWYDQSELEWVVVLRGEAKLRFEDQADLAHLRSGDFLSIRAHRKHRVEWTSSDQPTVWLAVFLDVT